MPPCYQCTIGSNFQSDAIGVCLTCSALACGYHGGKPIGPTVPGTAGPPSPQPRFLCCGCLAGAVTISAGGGGGSPSGGSAPGGSPPGGVPPGGSPAPGGAGSGSSGGSGGAATTAVGPPAPPVVQAAASAGSPYFASTFDFEVQVPLLASASQGYRRAVDPAILREAVRQLFALAGDEDDARRQYLRRAVAEVTEPVTAHVERQLLAAGAAGSLFEQRGGREQLIATAVGELTGRLDRFLTGGLTEWMAAIQPRVEESYWVGERDEVGGVIDLLLLADGIGLDAYTWGMDPTQAPLSRLDRAATAEVGLLVLADLYALGSAALVTT